jgi:ABC-type histidine transport system ATPase subunit
MHAAMALSLPESPAAPAAGGVQARGVEKRLGSVEVLRGVTLDVAAGEIVAILGSSGSGKSTFLRCVNLLTIPDQGDIWVHGERLKLRPISDRDPEPRILDHDQVRRVRASIGMVFQNFNLWPHMTALENVSAGPVLVNRLTRKGAAELGRHHLAKVGLSDKAGSYPRHLSGGQQQRVAIARALAMEPKLLLFDEPTSALDPELVGEVLRVMTALAGEGRTMMIVTHEVAFAREVSSRAAFMHEGRIDEVAASREFFSNPASARLRRFLTAHDERHS